MLVLASAQSNAPLFEALLVVGLIVGVFGHLARSRTLIISGILLIAAVSAYLVVNGYSSTVSGH
jgi:hypothetical protein